MPRTARSSAPAPTGAPTRAEQRRVAAAQRAALAQRSARRQRQARWIAVGLAGVAVVGAIALLATRGGGDPDGAGQRGSSTAAPVVGGDLHTLTAIGDALYVGGHAAAARSRDGGKTWQQIASLTGADPMGWAVTPDAILAGGHPGIFRSTDDGASFTQVTGAASVPDAHALGGSGTTLYLASPQAGLVVSADGGNTWQVRNAAAGRSFMGSILVDPNNPDRLIAPDMSGGLVTSTDGGRTFAPLGGATGAMAATWNPVNVDQIIAVAMNGGARSTDGGKTWNDISLPSGTSAVTYSANGRTVYAGALDGDKARTYRSTDQGTTWAPVSG